MNDEAWKQAWIRDEPLSDLNLRIHDVSLQDDALLLRRAEWLHETACEVLFPHVRPPAGSSVLEIGGGVGWPAEAARRRYGWHVTDLDVSPVMLQRARERIAALPDGATLLAGIDFVLYDGVEAELPNDAFDYAYSYATLWHVPPSYLAAALAIAHRCLRPGSSFVGQFLDPYTVPPGGWLDEAAVQRGGSDEHWHFHHVAEQLAWFFAQAGFENVLICRTVAWFDGSAAPYLWAAGTKPREPGGIRPAAIPRWLGPAASEVERLANRVQPRLRIAREKASVQRTVVDSVEETDAGWLLTGWSTVADGEHGSRPASTLEFSLGGHLILARATLRRRYPRPDVREALHLETEDLGWRILFPRAFPRSLLRRLTATASA